MCASERSTISDQSEHGELGFGLSAILCKHTAWEFVLVLKR